MTAEEARKATKEGKKIKGWQELDMMWICGRINHAIEKACRKGENNIQISFRQFRGDWLIEEIKQIYIKMGYDVHACRGWIEEKIIFKLTWE